MTGIDWVKYLATPTGIVTTLDPSGYQLMKGSDYGASVVPAFGQSWPAVRGQPEGVQILFSAGYANAAGVPEPIKAWIKLRVGALFENREAWTFGQKIETNDRIDCLLDRYRTWMT
ncbi:hypothetical protein CKY39_16205 [Variovorax boronicumulans]|uniref:Uncharacterized protein n=1 Tax=Variovorax boronicumulans TaxID=436515 RepID=A0A250DKT5_9BURK|nr:head-tail connector protein [Variovorax boronicumulans]ATA54579.1 hypothetical protein CKY39_16205 [Variovorax boronicumulans]